MHYFIDFENPNTFPQILHKWDSNFEKMILKEIKIDNVSEWWEIKNQLQDLNIEEMYIVSDFVEKNLDTEVAVYHCTRILDANDYWKQGIVTDGGKNSVGEKRIKRLLEDLEIGEEKINVILAHANNLWKRNRDSRTKFVHFFFDKNLVQKNEIDAYALNVGGEILRWSLEQIDKNLFKQEPYKRLWIKGTPSIIKFKVKLCDIVYEVRYQLIAEIVKYFIVKDLFGFDYEFEFTGMANGSIPPENIISIEEIKGFIEMQEKYSDMIGFYDELK